MPDQPADGPAAPRGPRGACAPGARLSGPAPRGRPLGAGSRGRPLGAVGDEAEPSPLPPSRLSRSHQVGALRARTRRSSSPRRRLPLRAARRLSSSLSLPLPPLPAPPSLSRPLPTRRRPLRAARARARARVPSRSGDEAEAAPPVRPSARPSALLPPRALPPRAFPFLSLRRYLDGAASTARPGRSPRLRARRRARAGDGAAAGPARPTRGATDLALSLSLSLSLSLTRAQRSGTARPPPPLAPPRRLPPSLGLTLLGDGARATERRGAGRSGRRAAGDAHAAGSARCDRLGLFGGDDGGCSRTTRCVLGGGGLLSLSLSVCLSFCLSVSLSLSLSGMLRSLSPAARSRTTRTRPSSSRSSAPRAAAPRRRRRAAPRARARALSEPPPGVRGPGRDGRAARDGRRPTWPALAADAWGGRTRRGGGGGEGRGSGAGTAAGRVGEAGARAAAGAGATRQGPPFRRRPRGGRRDRAPAPRRGADRTARGGARRLRAASARGQPSSPHVDLLREDQLLIHAVKRAIPVVDSRRT